MIFSTVLASGGAGSLDIGQILFELSLILIAAKVVGEIAERVGVPAVLGEILAGIIIGPSALGLVERSDSLFLMAELGAILLLMQVGMEIDVKELRSVGRSAMTVAVIGVSLPLLLGSATGLALGESGNTSLFIGATLTATSVGITARVFGDLRALATKEARVVLGAAVADDVLGLIILTIVTRIVEEGTVGIGTVATTMVTALAFLAIASLVGFTALPRIIGLVAKKASSPVAISVIAVGIALAYSGAADAAKLAPIIGAFVAGAALGSTSAHERIERDVSSLAAIFVPIFFLQIGIETDIASMARPKVLGIAGLLIVVAVFTKVAAGWGAGRGGGDKFLIGLGMMPRGEVGLIFATIGMGVGVFDDDLHAALVLVVLATTVISPAALRWRIKGNDSIATETDEAPEEEPAGGWISESSGRFELAAIPPAAEVPSVLLDAAVRAKDLQPAESFLNWIAAGTERRLVWTRSATTELLNVLRHGNSRSWRMIEAAALLDRTIPEVTEAMRRHAEDSTEMEPTSILHFPIVESLRDVTAVASSQNDTLLLAAFLADIDAGPEVTATILHKLDLDPGTLGEVDDLLNGTRILRAAVKHEPHRVDDKMLRDIAHGLRRPGNVERSRLLADAIGGLEPWQHTALIDFTTQVQTLLAHPELLSGANDSFAEMRRGQARELVSDTALVDRIVHAPTTYVLAHEPDVLVEQVRLIEPAPNGRDVRVSVANGAATDQFFVSVVCRNQKGLLSRLTAAIADSGFSVVSASLATWPDDTVLDSFVVVGNSAALDNLKSQLQKSVRGRLRPRRLPGTPPRIEIDNTLHPWHTIMRASGPDRIGLLAMLTYALHDVDVVVHHASVDTAAGNVDDLFEISDANGRKLTDSAAAEIAGAVAALCDPA